MTTKEEIADILDIQQKIYRDAVSKSEIVCLKQDLIDARKEVEDSKKLLTDQSITMKTLYSKIDKLETYSRRNNIRIDGLTEQNNENYQQTQKKLIVF